MKNITFGKHCIGSGRSCFIIAEAGVNHNGDINLAKKLIDIAKDAGCDAVKFQTWITEELVTKNAEKAEYQKQQTGMEGSQYDMIKKLEISYDNFKELKRYCDEKGILFMSTPDEEKSATFLHELGVQIFKMSSGELTNHRMLKHIASFGKPLILSTGMSTLEMIEDSVNVLKSVGFYDYMLLHCNANYPTEFKDVNLRAMNTLGKYFDVPYGYSDHTMGITVPIAAAARGAMIIEKHFTLDRNMEGPDHKASIEPDELAAMVKTIRDVEKALGSNKKLISDSERKNMAVMRKVIVASRNLKEGEIISSKELSMKRAGEGLSPSHESLLLGRILNKNIEQDAAISLDDVK